MNFVRLFKPIRKFKNLTDGMTSFPIAELVFVPADELRGGCVRPERPKLRVGVSEPDVRLNDMD